MFRTEKYGSPVKASAAIAICSRGIAQSEREIRGWIDAPLDLADAPDLAKRVIKRLIRAESGFIAGIMIEASCTSKDTVGALDRMMRSFSADASKEGELEEGMHYQSEQVLSALDIASLASDFLRAHEHLSDLFRDLEHHVAAEMKGKPREAILQVCATGILQGAADYLEKSDATDVHLHLKMAGLCKEAEKIAPRWLIEEAAWAARTVLEIGRLPDHPVFNETRAFIDARAATRKPDQDGNVLSIVSAPFSQEEERGAPSLDF